MERVPEPELMLDPAQARAYSSADFAAPHDRFVALFSRVFPGPARGRALDLGCGPADVTLRFARANPGCRVTGIDGSPAMLRLGRARIRAAPDARDRVELRLGLLPGARLRGRFPVIVSNSLLHHLRDPMVFWDAVRRFAARGARVFVVDLKRARSPGHARALTKRYARGAPASLRRDFYNSLLAAFTPREIRAQLRAAGLGHFQARTVSDRHVMVWGTMPR
jgi:SAM-dependent methyltransferase